VLDAATRYTELGDALLPLINPVMTGKYGIEIATFVVENVSVPKEVEEAIDKRSSMAAVGDLNEYVKFQMAQGMAEGGGGSGGVATELAVGFAIAQQMMQQQGGILGSPPAAKPGVGPGKPRPPVSPQVQTQIPDLLTPAQAAQAMGVSEDDVMAVIDSGELKAKDIGSVVRIKRSALEAFLAD
jgi:excisionase family DNA binding protein